jgi:uncharacterized protein YjbJ (UPF0337 family)
MDGTADDIKGRMKEAVGDLTDNDEMKREGKVDRASGKAKDKIQEAGDRAEDMVDDAKDRLHRD